MLATKSNSYTFQKDGNWYFSRRVPADLRRHYRTGRIAYSLRTKSIRDARIRAMSDAAKLDIKTAKKTLLLTVIATLTFLFMAITAHANTDKSVEIQKYLNALGYNVGAIDGIIGATSKRQLNQALADNGYLFDGNADEEELIILQKIAKQNNVIVSKSAPELIRMLNQPDIAIGIKLEPYTDTSLRPNRISEDRANVRSGDKALRLEIHPGDCGTPWPKVPGGWDDCSQGNERIGVNEERKRKGKWFYTASVFLDRSTFSKKPSTQTHINLMQWLDQKTEFGPPFNLMWFWQPPTASYLNTSKVRIPPMSLVFDNRLSRFSAKDQNGYESWAPMKVIGTDSSNNSITDQWLDFVIYANWTSKANGWFLVALNDEVILDYRGPTIEAGSAGLVFDVQLYRYGDRRFALSDDGIVTGDTNNIMFADNLGVFKNLELLDNHRQEFSKMARLLRQLPQNTQQDLSKFQPPTEFTREHISSRYEDCRSSPLCSY
jgi:hypothetical protein